jgi:hypothetical protein
MLKLIMGTERDKVKKVLMETLEPMYLAKTESPTKRILYPYVAGNLVELAQGELFDRFVVVWLGSAQPHPPILTFVIFLIVR